jgi:peroxiredoxin
MNGVEETGFFSFGVVLSSGIFLITALVGVFLLNLFFKNKDRQAARNSNELPDNLPVPEDDGACDHLDGRQIQENVSLKDSNQQVFNFPADLKKKSVLFIFPKAGSPLDPNLHPDEWDQIPGARGCTPQSCGYRDLQAEFNNLDFEIYGLSVQSTKVLNEIKSRNHISYTLLSDKGLSLQKYLKLPTFEFDHHILIKRMALVIINHKIEKVFYPVFPPDKNASEVLDWIKQNV